MAEILLPPHIQKSVDDKKALEAVGNWFSHYLSWKEDNSRIELFNNSKQIIIPEKVLLAGEEKEIWKMLVEAYIYYPEKTPNDIKHPNSDSELTLTQEEKMKSLPFIKILWHRDPEMIGKIFTVQDSYAQIGPNPAYQEYFEMVAEKPSLKGKVPVPPAWTSGWGALGKFCYQIEKFKKDPTLVDLHTFLIPETGFILTESNI